jgi:hypothetical protein
MRQVMRQIGVVIGLTVILTFPVTVVSGAGSQKHSEHSVRTSSSQWTIHPQAERAAECSVTSGAALPKPR